MGKFYKVVCRQGLNRDTCRFRSQDPNLICVQCSYCGFMERKLTPKTTKEEKVEEVTEEKETTEEDGSK